jgi:hypothetical protein
LTRANPVPTVVASLPPPFPPYVSLSRRAEAPETMRVFGTPPRITGPNLCLLVMAALCACDSDDVKQYGGYTEKTHAAADSLSSARAAVVADLQDRIVFVLSTSPNSPAPSIYTGQPGDSTLTVSIPGDTNHAAAQLVLQSPSLVRQLWSVGYRSVSFPDARADRTVTVSLPDPSAAELIATAPTGAQGELARRNFADSASVRLRAVGADARARGAEREVLYLDGLSGSANVAFGYANAVTGGMLALARLRALRFARLVVAGHAGSWCWNLSEPSGPTSCNPTDMAALR